MGQILVKIPGILDTGGGGDVADSLFQDLKSPILHMNIVGVGKHCDLPDVGLSKIDTAQCTILAQGVFIVSEDDVLLP